MSTQLESTVRQCQIIQLSIWCTQVINAKRVYPLTPFACDAISQAFPHYFGMLQAMKF